MSLHPGVSQFPKKHREEPYKLVEGLLDSRRGFDRLSPNGCR